ncbi:MAG: dUTP diphosphatase [Oscillospiraceae bacterium]|nr:dUTP diphosphatase [Oscillospiraceae bacterium]
MDVFVKIQAISDKIGREIPLPTYETNGSAGADLRACMDEPVTLKPLQRALIPTGIAIALPGAEFAALIMARSGLASKEGLTLANAVGLIDSDYRGEIKVAMVNLSDRERTIVPGQRIAQLVIAPVCRGRFALADSLDETARGAGGFGSTGLD